MHFSLVDAILEQSPLRIVTLKNVSAAEEYLQDHFPSFPVLPGVMMVEAMVQAARALLVQTEQGTGRWVLGSVKALKFGSFVRPGESLRVEVDFLKRLDDGSVEFKGVGIGVRATGSAAEGDGPNCVSGRFVMRPLRRGSSESTGGMRAARELLPS